MASTAEYDRWERPGWGSANGQGPSRDNAAAWQSRPWASRSGWHPGSIILTVLGFMIWWPIGLAFLLYTLWSGKMGCWHRDGYWQDRWERKMERMRTRMGAGFGYQPSSGNRAFDEYRTETLRRLEDEQRDFKDFLDRLRHAKDKQEFDAFMAERRSGPPTEPQSGHPQT